MSLRSPGSVLFISCYELGHQPLGVALPLGFLRRAGFAPEAMDIAVETFDAEKVSQARFIGISVPMHTALRLGVRVLERIRKINPGCHVSFYGLYASLNADYLLQHGVDSCVGGEYEAPLVKLVEALESGGSEEVEGVMRRGASAAPFLKRLPFAVPTRDGLPPLEKYAHLDEGAECRVAGYVEASRGCRHLCTHCPIPPVYGGRFFVIPEEVVLEDIRRQVQAGATHMTFGDPDFLNGPKHSLKVVRAMHAEFPALTFDFTAKIEHLLTRGQDLPEFAELGCLFITSAVESLSDTVLKNLEKGHTRSDVAAALKRARAAGISLRPTWVPFTPWAALEDYLEIFDFIEESEWVDQVDPVQYSIRLLVPPGSLLAGSAAMKPYLGPLDQANFTYRWTHPDPRMDRLQKEVASLVGEAARLQVDPAVTFYRIWELAGGRPSLCGSALPAGRIRPPRLTESWFC